MLWDWYDLEKIVDRCRELQMVPADTQDKSPIMTNYIWKPISEKNHHCLIGAHEIDGIPKLIYFLGVKDELLEKIV